MDCGSEDEYYVQYNAKDVIQYALSLGLGSQRDMYMKDLRYVFEDHADFSVFPTFALALIFWAKRGIYDIGTTSTIPRFPPPIMYEMGVIPKECIMDISLDVHSYPLIHTSQSMDWKSDLPSPTKTRENGAVVIMIKGKFISVHPKSVGTFVTTEYVLFERVNHGVATVGEQLIGTIRFTTLILGLPSEIVRVYDGNNHESHRAMSVISIETKQLLLELDCHIGTNTALMYRLASGDTNRMHVDPTETPSMTIRSDSTSDKVQSFPFIHGLCTLGITVRIILQHLHLRYGNVSLTVRLLECQFKKPVFINDIVTVRAWEVTVYRTSTVCDKNHFITILFTVVRKTSSESILVDDGRIHVNVSQKINKMASNNLLAHL